MKASPFEARRQASVATERASRLAAEAVNHVGTVSPVYTRLLAFISLAVVFLNPGQHMQSIDVFRYLPVLVQDLAGNSTGLLDLQHDTGPVLALFQRELRERAGLAFGIVDGILVSGSM